MAIGSDRQSQGRSVAGATGETRAIQALHAAPSVVATAHCARLLDVDLFDGVLADIADPQVASRAVEGRAPRIAKAVSPNLIVGGHAANKRVVRWNRVVRRNAAHGGLDAMHLGEAGREVLTIAVGIVGRATIANTDIEIVVGTEADPSAVVVGERISPGHHDHARGIGNVGVGGRTGVARDDIGAGSGVVDVELAVLCIPGIKGQAEQTTLVVLRGSACNHHAQKRRWEQRVGGQVEDADGAALLQDEQPRGVRGGGSDIGREVEPRSDPVSPHIDDLSVSRWSQRGHDKRAGACGGECRNACYDACAKLGAECHRGHRGVVVGIRISQNALRGEPYGSTAALFPYSEITRSQTRFHANFPSNRRNGLPNRSRPQSSRVACESDASRSPKTVANPIMNPVANPVTNPVANTATNHITWPEEDGSKVPTTLA